MLLFKSYRANFVVQWVNAHGTVKSNSKCSSMHRTKTNISSFQHETENIWPYVIFYLIYAQLFFSFRTKLVCQNTDAVIDIF